ncbi:Fur family transcriptional regulator [Thermosulfuriphilus sp.]
MNQEKIEKYRGLGLKMTPQRLAILEYLEDNKEHPSAEDIYRHVRIKFPSMSFATVYNTLEALKERGLVQELHIDPSKKRFDPDTTPHNHLICLRCHKIVDIFTNPPLNNIPEEELKGYKIVAAQVVLYGFCPECQKKDSEENHSF